MNTYQVSVLVCTVNTLLARSLRSWLDNDPREVIIVTIPEHEDHIRSVVDNADLDAYDFPKVKIVTSPIKGKRAQMVEGIKHVQGVFIANVDDHITWHDAFLREMRACWDEPSLEQNLGAVAATIEGIIPEDRCDEKVITPYEVAAMRVCWDRNPKHVVAWSAARWSWGLCGASYLVRADIFKVRTSGLLLLSVLVHLQELCRRVKPTLAFILLHTNC
jgi:glycosyltransferase involved in cell wall biosynthesis